jgi:chromosome segregation ATPase
MKRQRKDDYAALAAAVAEKDRTIISLHADLERQAEMMRKHDPSTVGQSGALLLLTRQFEEERTSNINLREQLTLANGEVRALRAERQRLLEEVRALAGQLSETRWEQAELLQKTNEMSECNRLLKVKLDDRECQVRSLEAVIAEERKAAATMGTDKTRLTQQIRALQKQGKEIPSASQIIKSHQANSALDTASTTDNKQIKLFGLVKGSCLIGIELQRGEDGLGFSLATKQLPFSSDTCIIVQSVRSGSPAEHQVLEGDEIVEIDGQLCRNLPQSVIAARLRSSKAVLQLVMNRQLSSNKCSQIRPWLQDDEKPLLALPIKESLAGETTNELLKSTYGLCQQTHCLLVELELHRWMDSLHVTVEDSQRKLEQISAMVSVKEKAQETEQRGTKGPDLLDISVDKSERENQTNELSSLTNIRESLSAIVQTVNEIRQSQLEQEQDTNSSDRTFIVQEDEVFTTQSTSQVKCLPDLFVTSSPINEHDKDDKRLSHDSVLSPSLPNSPLPTSPPPVTTEEQLVSHAISQFLPSVEGLLEKKLEQMASKRNGDSESSQSLANELMKQLQEERQVHVKDSVSFQEEINHLRIELRKRELEQQMEQERRDRDTEERESKDKAQAEEMKELYQRSLVDQHTVEEMKKQLTERDTLIDTLKEDIARKNENMKHMIVEQLITQRTVTDMEKQRKDTIARSEKTNLQLQEEVKQASRQVQESYRENDSLKQQLNELQDRYTSTVQEKETLTFELAAIEAKMATDKKCVEANAKSHQQQTEKLCQELDTAHIKLNQVEMEMQVRARQLEETCREYNKQVNSLSKQLEETEADKRQLIDEKEKLQDKVVLSDRAHDEIHVQLEKMEAEAADLLNQKAVLDQSYQQCESERCELELALKQVQRELDAAQRELENSQIHTASIEKSLQDTLHELNEKKVTLKEAETRLVSVEQRKRQLDEELCSSKATTEELQADVVRVQASYHAQERLLEEVRQQLDEKKNEIMGLKNERGLREEELKKTHEKLAHLTQKDVGLETRIVEVEASLSAMSDREKRLEEQLSNAIQRAKEKEIEATTSMDALQARNLLLQEDLASKDASLLQSAHSHADTSGRMEQMRKELDRLRDELMEQRTTIMKNQSDMARQQTNTEQVLHKLKKREERILAMEEEMSMLHATNDMLKQAVEKEKSNKKISQEKEEIEKLLKDMQMELGSKVEMLEKAESSVMNLQSEKLRLEEQVAVQEGEVLASQVELVQVKQVLEEERKDNEQLKTQLTRQATESHSLKEHNSQLITSCDELRCTMNRISEENVKCKELVKTLESAYEEQRIKCEKLTMLNTELAKRLENELNDRQKTVSQLDREIKSFNTEISTLKQANALQQMQLEQATAAQDQLKVQLDSEKARSKVEVGKLQDELYSQREATLMNRATVLELQNDLERMRKDLTEKTESLKKTEEALKREHNGRKTVEEESNKLKHQLQSKEEQVSQMEEQNRDVQSTLTATYQQISELSRRLDEAQTATTMWKCKTEEKDLEINRLIQDRQQSMDEIQNVLHEAENKQRGLEEEARAERDRADVLHATMERLNSEIHQATEARNESEKANSLLVNETQMLTKRNRDAESTIQQLLSCQNSLQEMLSKANEEKDKDVTALQARIEVLKRNMQNKTAALELLEASDAELRKRLESAEQETQRAAQQLGQLNELQAKLVDEQTRLAATNRELVAVKTQAAAVQGERDQLMATLREHGVQRHTEKPSTPAAMKRLQSGTASKQDVLVLLKDKHEEAQRLKEYVDKLLSAVVDKAPFVLELIT